MATRATSPPRGMSGWPGELQPQLFEELGGFGVGGDDGGAIPDVTPGAIGADGGGDGGDPDGDPGGPAGTRLTFTVA